MKIVSTLAAKATDADVKAHLLGLLAPESKDVLAGFLHERAFIDLLAEFQAFPGVDVAKAFNTLFAQVVAEGPAFADGQVARAFYAGDSERAKATAKSLIESTGFQPVDAGPLRNARYLEPLAGLNIYFGYGAGHGTTIAPRWISRS